MTKKIVIGSRASALALAQSVWVKERLEKLLPDHHIEISTMHTEGDRRLDSALSELGGKGLFTYELEEKLRKGEIDLAVHSLKDMPQKMPDDLPIAALSIREDPRDALILSAEHSDEEIKLFGTSSPRRCLQLKTLYPDAKCVTLRGNVNTRLKKLDSADCDAIVLAAAGLKRLNLENRISKYFEVDEMIPAAGQGILAIQSRILNEDSELFKSLGSLNDKDSCDAYNAESAFLRRLEADCTSPIGAYARINGSDLHLIAVMEDNDAMPIRGEIRGQRGDARALGAGLAERMLETL